MTEFNPLLFKPKVHLLQFETNTYCNGKCRFCEYPRMKRKGTAKWSLLLDIMYWWVHRVAEVCPFGMQEPLLEPRLPAILTNIKQLNPQIDSCIYTNMSVWNEQMWRDILKWQVLDKVCLSFYGVDKQTYNGLQPGLDYYQVQRNITKLLRLKRKMKVDKPEVNLHVLLMPETTRKAEKLANKWRGKCDKVGYVRWDSWCGNQPYDDKFETSVWGPQAEKRTPCPRLWQVLTIHYDGTVVPCCLDAHELEPCGNVKDDMETFYTNKRLEELRTLHLEGRQDEIALCRNCTLWKRDHDPVWNNLWTKKRVSSVVSPFTK
jgi:radical SAM protein with 4Fe4S-binding SPASM domain